MEKSRTKNIKLNVFTVYQFQYERMVFFFNEKKLTKYWIKYIEYIEFFLANY